MITSLVDLTDTLKAGELSLTDYVNALETHFEAREPDVLAFLPEEGRFDRVRREAQTLLEQYPDPESRPPLFGVPVGVKDIFHADGFQTHGGSKVPPERLAGPQAESVTRLKNAGALILGKTVTTEFAYFGPGPTRNPHNAQHTPGGSSSGSAAALGARLCPLALGTQTIGSINRPAAFCGAVGYKPSYERISREGVIPLSPSVDHIGFFTADTAGAELAASVLVHDWKAMDVEAKPILAVPEGPYLQRASSEGIDHVRDATQRLVDAGYEVKSIDALSDFDAIYDRHNLIVAAEAARVHTEWFAEFESVYHARTAELIKHGQPISDNELAEALAGREKLRAELAALMDRHGIDLWITPPAPGSAPKGLTSTGDPVMNLPWTHAGLPTLTIPSGANSAGLPLGVQLGGRWHNDESLLKWAQGIESVLRPTT